MANYSCRGTRRDGTPCQAPPSTIGSSGYCWAHDPTNAVARRQAQAKGGRNKSTSARAEKLVPAVLRPVLDTLLAAVDDVRGGALTTQQAGALASLAGAIVKVYQAGVLEERVAALELAQAEGQSRRSA